MASPPGAFGLTRDQTATEALDLIVRSCGQRILEQVDPLLAGRDAATLHDMRVGLRRLRAAFALLRRPLGDDDKLSWVSTETRDLAAPLGRARDLDITLSTHADLLSGSPRRKLHARREAAYDEVVDVVTSDRWRDLARHLDILLRHLPDQVPVDPPLAEAAAVALDRRFRRVRDRGADLARSSASHGHRVRIEAKKLRYGTQFFDGLYAVPAPFADAVESLQGSLGEWRDAEMSRHLLASVGAPTPDVDRSALLQRAVTAHDDLVTLGRYWR
ncbi:CHAD domain-containing protein [Knoellia subterranea]|uniref:CHAD domain-containing protein n=1 Tax=Knoellia subterranea TaxID=184882 RepID=UPI000A5BF3B8|nr:CHAD domain-containing protein [Knoellia subterranea]